jgi:uncharacterized membrane protein
MVLKTVRARGGRWAFLVGVIFALVFGALGTLEIWVLWLLVIAGIIVGLANIKDDEVSPFLMASLSLIIASAFGGGILDILPIIGNVLRALLVLFVPATIIVAIKHVFSFAKH